MRTTHWLITGAMVFFLHGCAGISTAPTAETRRALAPTGKLRVGLVLGAPTSVIRDSGSGEMKGVGFDLGKEFARRMGVPFEPVVYQSGGALLDGAKLGQWDVTVLSVSPARAKTIDFSQPILAIEMGYLATKDFSVTRLADVDRPGVRVAVPERGQADSLLSRSLKNAQIIRVQNTAAGLQILKSGKADVFAGNKPRLFEMSDQLPGFRVLNGGFAIVELAMAIPKGKKFGMEYVRKFVEDAKPAGLVNAAIERVGLRGVIVVGVK